MKKHTRPMITGIGALLAFGLLPGCSGGSTTEATSSPAAPPETSTAAEVPDSARYMADMTAAGGETMTIGISVDGSEVAAYACNGTDDEAWFFGNQTAGEIDIKSKFRDTLTADINGDVATGEVMMDGVEYDFTANAVSGLAGMYTAEADGVRASWVGASGWFRDRRSVQRLLPRRPQLRSVQPGRVQRLRRPQRRPSPAQPRARGSDRISEQPPTVEHQRHTGDPVADDRHHPVRLTRGLHTTNQTHDESNPPRPGRWDMRSLNCDRSRRPGRSVAATRTGAKCLI